ncbi:MAG: SseB family protein [Oscillospiraceae bacterium]|nr:SseB family protein [Oscillospiraceae bacterium]
MVEEAFEKITDWAKEFKDFNSELEERILEANHDDTKVKWNKLLPDLMGAEVFIAGQYSGQPIDDSGRKELNIVMIQKDGHAIIPFFTSPERLSVLVNPQNNQFDVLKLNTVRLFESLVGKHTVLNPMSSYTRMFTPFEMRILAAENADKAPALPEKEEKSEDKE